MFHVLRKSGDGWNWMTSHENLDDAIHNAEHVAFASQDDCRVSSKGQTVYYVSALALFVRTPVTVQEPVPQNWTKEGF